MTSQQNLYTFAGAAIGGYAGMWIIENILGLDITQHSSKKKKKTNTKNQPKCLSGDVNCTKRSATPGLKQSVPALNPQFNKKSTPTAKKAAPAPKKTAPASHPLSHIVPGLSTGTKTTSKPAKTTPKSTSGTKPKGKTFPASGTPVPAGKGTGQIGPGFNINTTINPRTSGTDPFAFQQNARAQKNVTPHALATTNKPAPPVKGKGVLPGDLGGPGVHTAGPGRATDMKPFGNQETIGPDPQGGLFDTTDLSPGQRKYLLDHAIIDPDTPTHTDTSLSPFNPNTEQQAVRAGSMGIIVA